LFNVDLILWAAKRFVNIGEPWDTVYEVASNGFFCNMVVTPVDHQKTLFQNRNPQ